MNLWDPKGQVAVITLRSSPQVMQKEQRVCHLNTRRLPVLTNYRRIREMRRKPQVPGSGSRLSARGRVVAGKRRQESASSLGNPQFQPITPNESPKSPSASCTNKLKSRMLSIPANYLLKPAVHGKIREGGSIALFMD